MAMQQSTKPRPRTTSAAVVMTPRRMRTLTVWLVTSTEGGDKAAYLTEAEAQVYAKRWRKHTGERVRVVPMAACLTPVEGGLRHAQ